MLEAAPKFGTIEIITDPNNLLVTSPGQPAMVFPGSRVDITYPTRSKVMFQDISVTEDFVFTIHGEGAFQDKTYTVPAFGQPDSPWVQSYTGDYTASATFGLCWSGEPARVDEKFCIYPSTEPEWLARELRWRMDWRPDPEADGETMPTRLLGSVTVTSDPPAALIAFNGRQLVNEESQEPHRTPFTFSTYNAALDVEDRTPAEVYLSREGLPLTVLYEGKVTAMMGVYLHQFQCTLRSGAEPPPPAPAPTPEQIAGTEPMPEPPSWLNLCDYTYSVHLELQDPPPPEGSGEGSGEAPADAAAQATP